MKKLLSLLAVLATLFTASAATVVIPMAVTTISNAIPSDAIITQISFTSASAASIFFHDAATAVTNRTYTTYTNKASYATNIVSVITNTVGFLQTNTVAGTFTYDVVVTGSARALPTIMGLSVPAGGVVTASVNLNVVNGLSAQSTAAGTLTVTYTVDQ